MATVNQIISALEKLQYNIGNLVDATIEETKSYLTDDIKAQLIEGLDASGNKIKPRYRNARYAKGKALMNPKPGYGTPDLRLSGTLYNKLFVSLYEEKLLFSSDVDYASLLEEKYSIRIFESGKANLNEYVVQQFRPVLIRKIETFTGLKFN